MHFKRPYLSWKWLYRDVVSCIGLLKGKRITKRPNLLKQSNYKDLITRIECPLRLVLHSLHSQLLIRDLIIFTSSKLSYLYFLYFILSKRISCIILLVWFRLYYITFPYSIVKFLLVHGIKDDYIVQ